VYFLYVEFSDFYVNQSLAGQIIVLKHKMKHFFKSVNVNYNEHAIFFFRAKLNIDNQEYTIWGILCYIQTRDCTVMYMYLTLLTVCVGDVFRFDVYLGEVCTVSFLL
jgi:hypothetical protein